LKQGLWELPAVPGYSNAVEQGAWLAGWLAMVLKQEWQRENSNTYTHTSHAQQTEREEEKVKFVWLLCT